MNEMTPLILLAMNSPAEKSRMLMASFTCFRSARLIPGLDGGEEATRLPAAVQAKMAELNGEFWRNSWNRGAQAAASRFCTSGNRARVLSIVLGGGGDMFLFVRQAADQQQALAGARRP